MKQFHDFFYSLIAFAFLAYGIMIWRQKKFSYYPRDYYQTKRVMVGGNLTRLVALWAIGTGLLTILGIVGQRVGFFRDFFDMTLGLIPCIGLFVLAIMESLIYVYWKNK